MNKYLTIEKASEQSEVSKSTLRRWDKKGQIVPARDTNNNYRIYSEEDLSLIRSMNFIGESEFTKKISPYRDYKVIELFAGAGGLAIGLEKSGLTCFMLNEIDRDACQTLKINRPNWNVIHGDIKNIDFYQYRNRVDIITGGFPCQAFSYAGKKLGLEDARGTLFYEFARAIKEVNPLIAIGENVRGLLTHDYGKTIQGMVSILNELGYDVLPPRLIKMVLHRVPQKRERLLIVAVRKNSGINFEFPKPHNKIYTVRDALKKGELYPTDVPNSLGQLYPEKKKEIMEKIPQGGYWRNLSDDLQREYMKKSYFLGGGKTGMARRIAWDEPCLTLTCNPAQKQTERCHPEETRPFTVREYARIQTFPDSWIFSGSISSQYRQIGNAIPVNFAEELGYSLIKALNEYEEKKSKTQL